MLQKVFQKITRSIFILSFVFSCSFQLNAQVEFKLNPPAALFGFFQTGLEFPIGNDLGVETELIFFAIDGEVGGRCISPWEILFQS